MTYRQRRNLDGYLFLLPYTASFLGFIVLPLIVSLVLSVMRFDLTNPHQIQFVGGANFAEAWKDQYFWKAFDATVRYALMMVPILVITALCLSLGMNRMVRGQTTVRALVYLPGIFTISVTAVIWQWFYNLEFGLFNFALKAMHLPPVAWLSDAKIAMPSIVVMSLWWTLGGTAVIFLAAVQQVPQMFYEAAALDGANAQQLFRFVTLPHVRPVLLFVAVTNTIAAFQMFPQASLLTQGGPEFSTRGVVQLIYETAFNNYRLGYAAAISWMLTAVIAVFALAQLKLFSRRGEA